MEHLVTCIGSTLMLKNIHKIFLLTCIGFMVKYICTEYIEFGSNIVVHKAMRYRCNY
ncbi:unnamed protein product [Chironomus riparius]|uniref:Uncharacterized protein n=1 Tax=Chironomus riparius TaxID=315576 RepID=A0A9N9RR87_9DIPT|nr:unnamed protein product [Chironomus riparius]